MAERKRFRENYPALSRELESGQTQKHRISGVRTMTDETESKTVERFTPDVVDYLRRCDTTTQAFEIVDYMVSRGELSARDAKAIKRQIKSEGLRSFGEKKEKDHYLHHGLE